jgi:2-iminobutanoate/2-iminopropanoate deaminase
MGVPKTNSPISQAVVAGSFCFVSGQLPVDRKGLLVKGSFTHQSRIALNNVISVLEASGFCLRDVVYVDVALLRIADLQIINRLFKEVFEIERQPARTVYQAAALPLGSSVKFQAVAYKS